MKYFQNHSIGNFTRNKFSPLRFSRKFDNLRVKIQFLKNSVHFNAIYVLNIISILFSFSRSSIDISAPSGCPARMFSAVVMYIGILLTEWRISFVYVLEFVL